MYERVRTKEGEKRENGRREEGKRKIEVIEGVIESGEEFKKSCFYIGKQTVLVLLLREKKIPLNPQTEMLEEKQEQLRLNAECRAVLC